MKNDRFRVPMDDGYSEAVGRAVYVFSSAEWMAVHCCEKMKKDYLKKVAKKTAGQIAADLKELVQKLPMANTNSRCLNAASEFERLVKVRNDLIHSNPGTAPEGTQALFRYGNEWTIAKITDAADEFAACSIELNEIYYCILK